MIIPTLTANPVHFGRALERIERRARVEKERRIARMLRRYHLRHFFRRFRLA